MLVTSFVRLFCSLSRKADCRWEVQEAAFPCLPDGLREQHHCRGGGGSPETAPFPSGLEPAHQPVHQLQPAEDTLHHRALRRPQWGRGTGCRRYPRPGRTLRASKLYLTLQLKTAIACKGRDLFGHLFRFKNAGNCCMVLVPPRIGRTGN